MPLLPGLAGVCGDLGFAVAPRVARCHGLGPGSPWDEIEVMTFKTLRRKSLSQAPGCPCCSKRHEMMRSMSCSSRAIVESTYEKTTAPSSSEAIVKRRSPLPCGGVSA